MHITEFIGIYLITLCDKINKFCGRFRAHARKSLWWLATWHRNRTAGQGERSTERDDTGTQRLRG